MKRNGPRPTPTTILEARGSWKAKTRHHEPIPKNEFIQPPDYLDDLAKEEWFRLSAQVYEFGFMSEYFKRRFETYCTGYSLWRKFHKEVSCADASEYATPDFRKNMINMMSALKVWTDASEEFGMSPAAITKVGSVRFENQGKDKKEKHIKLTDDKPKMAKIV